MMDRSFLESCFKTLGQINYTSAYKKAFTVLKADTDELRAKAFNIRYQVYCEENSFLPRHEYENEQETDKFDLDATHFLLIHNTTGEAVGTLRVLMPKAKRPLTCFETQKYCDHPLLQIENRIAGMAEISKFCMVPSFRKRALDGDILPGYYGQDTGIDDNATRKSKSPLSFLRRRISYAPVGLLSAAFEMILEHGILEVMMAAEPKSLEGLRDLGVPYNVLGPRLDMGHVAQPILFNIRTVLDNMMARRAADWEILSDGGRLSDVAGKIYETMWQDSVVDDLYKEMARQTS